MNGEGRPGGGTETAEQLAKATPEYTSYARGLRRRRAASRRLPVLDSGRSDPWAAHDAGFSGNTEKPTLRGYAEAAHHLLAHDLTPAPNAPALRQMWKDGGDDRSAAQVIAEHWGRPT